MPAKDNKNIRAKIIVRAWKDPTFKEKLLKNPRTALKEMGLETSENVELKVVEDKRNTFTFVLPAPIAEMGTLSEAELEKLAGGVGERTIQVTCTKQKSRDRPCS